MGDLCLICWAAETSPGHRIAEFVRQIPEQVRQMSEQPTDPGVENMHERRSAVRQVVKRTCNHDEALIWAAVNGQVDELEILVDKGVAINPLATGPRRDLRMRMIDYFGNPLCASLASENMEGARFLIERGAHVKPLAATMPLNCPLLVAACYGNVEGVRLLISSGAEVNEMIPRSTMYGSALLAAVDFNQMDCARFLVEQGADVNAQFEHGVYGNAFTAAVFAYRPNLDMVKFLVEEHNAEPIFRNYWPRDTERDHWREREHRREEHEIEDRKEVVKYLLHQFRSMLKHSLMQEFWPKRCLSAQ